jgi:type VI secretion system protein ImpG
MINLFKHRAEPIRLTGVTGEYRVIPDSRRPGALEVYSIDNVSVASPTGDVVVLNPIFGLKHAGAAPREMRFWHSARRATPSGASETFLTFVDLDGDPTAPADWVASLDTTCSNVDLPSKLPFGGGRPYLQLTRERTEVAAITCLTPPTPQLRLQNRREGVWRLISHLNLNHLSLADQAFGPEALREILYLYDFRDAPETRGMIDSLIGVRSARGTARAPRSGMGVLCHGLDISLQFDEQPTSGTGVFLLAAVLERFIAHYASINTFTRLTASIKGRSGVLRTWPPRAGDLTLL